MLRKENKFTSLTWLSQWRSLKHERKREKNTIIRQHLYELDFYIKIFLLSVFISLFCMRRVSTSSELCNIINHQNLSACSKKIKFSSVRMHSSSMLWSKTAQKVSFNPKPIEALMLGERVLMIIYQIINIFSIYYCSIIVLLGYSN